MEWLTLIYVNPLFYSVTPLFVVLNIKKPVKLEDNNDLYEDIENIKIGQLQIHRKLSKFQLKNSLLVVLTVLVLANIFFQIAPISSELKNDFFSSPGSSTIDFLRGDTIDTFARWMIFEDDPIHIHVLDNGITSEQIQAINDVIFSKESKTIRDVVIHTGSKGTSSTYFNGWAEAFDSISYDTAYVIPKKFHVHETTLNIGDIVISLENHKDLRGNSGFTEIITDKSQNQILKANITIYDSQNLESSKLSIILRHELGHAFGLQHSTDPDDLMYPEITTNYPLISECDIASIKELYNGEINSKITCEK